MLVHDLFKVVGVGTDNHYSVERDGFEHRAVIREGCFRLLPCGKTSVMNRARLSALGSARATISASGLSG